MPSPAPLARIAGAQGVGDQLRQASEELGAHARMKALLVGAAERQEAERSLLPERYQRERGHLGAFGPEEKLALRVARLATAWFAGGEQRLEGLKVRIIRRHGAHEVLTGQIRVCTDEHEHRMERVEVLA